MFIMILCSSCYSMMSYQQNVNVSGTQHNYMPRQCHVPSGMAQRPRHVTTIESNEPEYASQGWYHVVCMAALEGHNSNFVALLVLWASRFISS